MPSFQAAVTLSIAFIGNCGFWLFCFNRLNAAGLPRRLTKRLEKSIVAVCFAIPFFVAAVDFNQLQAWMWTMEWWPTGTSLFRFWAAWSIASVFVLGPLWLESRRWLIPPRHLKASRGEAHHLGREIPGGSAGDSLTRFFGNLPGNQITQLEVSRKELLLPRSIAAADGLTIGHLSDLHFTGQLQKSHYHAVIDRFMELQPDLIAVTGDIIDYDRCLPWIDEIMGRLTAPLGVAFVLGNHDKRISDVNQLIQQLTGLGHFDIGAEQRCVHSGDLRIQLIGNELPWFNRFDKRRLDGSVSLERSSSQYSSQSPVTSSCDFETQPSDNALRLGLSHSPDQIRWARTRGVDLLLAGHTHGGQARLPGIGPILAPSFYGSKFASGVFYLEPTLMHVSRGVAGTHPLRWWCRPEVSLLTLRSPA